MRSLSSLQAPRYDHKRTISGDQSSGGSDELAELEQLDSLRIEDDDEDILVDSSLNSTGGVGANHYEMQTMHPPSSEVSANVLNDIGNMLANLTDELDAMLEEEKRAGLNDD